jgi:hypothetical protein
MAADPAGAAGAVVGADFMAGIAFHASQARNWLPEGALAGEAQERFMQLDGIAAISPPATKPGGGAAPGMPGFDTLLQGPPALGASTPQPAPTGPDGAAQAAAVAQAGVGGYAGAKQAEVADREARRYGRAMLHALATLQMAVLDGDPTAARQALAALAMGGPAAADPVLRLILREIAARAAAELARGAIISNVSVA